MWGRSPFGDWAANSVDSSVVARRQSTCDQPMALKAESQLHWWGYRRGPGRVALPSQLDSSTARARSATSTWLNRMAPAAIVRAVVSLLDVQTEAQGDGVRIVLTGELDISTAPRVEDELRRVE